MKRLILLVLVAVSAPVALAFDPAPVRGNRIGILTTDAGDDPATLRVASLMRGYLAGQLKKQGFDAFDTRATFEELERTRALDADYYVEFIRAETNDNPYGFGGVGGRHAGVDLALVVSHVAAGVRLYDGRTLEVMDEFDVEARDRSVIPTAIGLGQRGLGVWVGLPVGLLRSRSVAKEAARDAAISIAGIIESEAGRE
ncbi:MAG TPA: hypothetical protein VFT12_13225 [Thermoanaerobaculia bacterium]|nr:hypothetical protein [Thermoanaerobaculia bacterium]